MEAIGDILPGVLFGIWKNFRSKKSGGRHSAQTHKLVLASYFPARLGLAHYTGGLIVKSGSKDSLEKHLTKVECCGNLRLC